MKKSRQKQAYKITLIGAGNLATHLGLRLSETGFEIAQVFSRTKRSAKSLAKKLNCKFTTDLKEIDTQSDLYILAVSDGAITEVATKLSRKKTLQKKLIVHTSGATPALVLQPFFKNYGVFYPVQTFSKKRKIDFSQIPICIDARYAKDRKRLEKIGSEISNRVFVVNDEQRAVLHVAAVFVNNFSNHLFHIGEQLMEQNGMSFDLLRPLLLETALKVQTNSPSEMQTGPAIRKDLATIEKHLQFLGAQHPEFLDVYYLLTQGIK